MINDIMTTLKKATDSLVKEGISGQHHIWTGRILSELTQLSNQKGFRVFTKPNEADRTVNEWLYDFVAYTGPSPIEVEKIEFVMESEFSTNVNDILYDFYKLLHCKCRLKVMFFKVSKRKKNDHFETLAQIIKNSKVCDESDLFLLAAWDDYDGITYRIEYK